MKTLSYYKQLRESYACIIPKTAPAWELIEALDALIAHLTPQATTQGYSIFEFYGQQLRIPEGWHMARDDDDDYILLDAAGVAFGKVCMTREGDSWAYVDTAPGGAQYSSTLLGALNGLIGRAWGSADAAS